MSVELPEQVRAGLAAAEAIEAAMAPANTPPADPAPAPAPEEPKPAEAQAPPAAEPPPPAPAPEPWEARYRTLQGMYDADVKAVRAENANLTTRLDTLQKEMDALKAAPQPPKPSPAAPPTGITPQDVEAFGDDLVDVINRAAAAKAVELTADLRAEVEALKQTTTTVQDSVTKVAATNASQAQNQFVAKLTELVPDWESVNQDPLFLKWCGEVNPLTGAPNQSLLDAASKEMDPARVAAIFSAYKTQAAPAAAPTPAPAADPARRAELESQIAPGTAKPTPTTVPTQVDKVWTTAEIDAFYRQVSKGEFKGREAEAQAIENAIDQAIATNRVR